MNSTSPHLFKEQLKAFEQALDGQLAKCAVYGMNASEALALLANVSDVMAHQNPMSNFIDKGGEVFAPYLVTPTQGAPIDLEAFVADLGFAAHYYMLREYLYYAYNSPGAFDWTFSADRVAIRFLDPSIPRQFLTSHNEAVLGALHHFSDKSISDALADKVLDLKEWDPVQNEEVMQLLEAEANHKLSAYFTIIPPESPIDLGGFTYAEFFAFYRLLVAKALWHRHHATVHGVRGAVWIEEDDLVAAAHERLGIEPPKLQLMLRDLVYDAAASQQRLSPSYFSLLRDGSSGKIWLRPVHFCLHEGVVGLLRVMAQRRSNQFLTHVSGPLGNGLVDRMMTAFAAQGFRCLRDVDLTPFDPGLPDIDLLVISEEPTLGYVILVCELKSPVPAQWAKDHLRALNADGLSKAFRQSQKVAEFLTTECGLGLIQEWLPGDGLFHFDHFVVVLEPLVITSHNAGMLFEDETTPVFNYHTIERMLRASDGDMAYIQHMLRTYNRVVDEHQRTRLIETTLLDRRVIFELVEPEAVLGFPLNAWRSDGSREACIQEFLASGAQPIDSLHPVFRSLARDTEVDEADAVPDAAATPPSTGAAHRSVILVDRNAERFGQILALAQVEPASVDGRPVDDD